MSFADGKCGYGWLNRVNNSVGGGSGFLYDYGWPAGGSLEYNVFAQWTFNETSGSIFDICTALEVPVAYYPAGVHYSISSGTNDWPGDGIRLEGNALFGLTSDIGLSIAGDFVFETVCLLPDAFSNIVWSLNGYQFAFFICGSGSNVARVYFGDGTNNVNADLPIPSGVFSGYHKYRFAGTVGGSVELFVDGVSCGSLSLASLTGPITSVNGIGIGWWNGVAASTDITFREVRITNGNKTNNSGGPGGG